MSLLATIVITVLAALLGASSVLSVGYLLTLLTAGSARRRPLSLLSDDRLPRVAVIVPAHNEEPVIGATLASLRALDYPRGLLSTVVIADNCTDTTALIARSSGATVLERSNLVERGKGYALAFAMQHLLTEGAPADIFVIVDADTWVAPDFLRIMTAEIAGRVDSHGYCAVQGRYGVLNTDDGWRAALMAGAFDLFNHVKPLGRDARGFSVGLKGNGMGFTRSLLQIAPFRGDSITEDIDYGLDLLLQHGICVGYAPSALVRAQMPVTADQAKSQRARWEGGRYRLMRERAPALLAASITSGSARLLDAAIDLIIPPLAEIAAILAAWAICLSVGAATGHLLGLAWVWGLLVAITVVGLVGYILGGFRVSGAPPAAYQALLRAPLYAFWKFALYAAKPFARKSRSSVVDGNEWVRTERIGIATPATAATTDERGSVS